MDKEFTSEELRYIANALSYNAHKESGHGTMAVQDSTLRKLTAQLGCLEKN